MGYTGYVSTLHRFKVKGVWYEVRSYYLRGGLGIGLVADKGDIHWLNIPKFGDGTVCWTNLELVD